MKNDNQWRVLILLLKDIAQEKGITQNQIAELTGLKQSNISRVFSLKYKPNLDLFLQIAKAVGVNFFIQDKGSKTDLNKVSKKLEEKK